jgi:murein DD-endopeptidase MepM/ murein hydrolase activator NlpD
LVQEPSVADEFLCTQGMGGRLTHFFKESHHAIDFRCDEGTEVLAMADGVVTEISQTNVVTGCHCSNLAKWNSISLAVDNKPDHQYPTGSGEDKAAEGELPAPSTFTVEYVHIAPNSAMVAVGDRVRAGQVLCSTGRIGFAPEPHLHLEIHRTDDLKGPSVRFELASARGKGSPYMPMAGGKYGPDGPSM